MFTKPPFFQSPKPAGSRGLGDPPAPLPPAPEQFALYTGHDGVVGSAFNNSGDISVTLPMTYVAGSPVIVELDCEPLLEFTAPAGPPVIGVFGARLGGGPIPDQPFGPGPNGGPAPGTQLALFIDQGTDPTAQHAVFWTAANLWNVRAYPVGPNLTTVSATIPGSNLDSGIAASLDYENPPGTPTKGHNINGGTTYIDGSLVQGLNDGPIAPQAPGDPWVPTLSPTPGKYLFNQGLAVMDEVVDASGAAGLPGFPGIAAVPAGSVQLQPGDKLSVCILCHTEQDPRGSIGFCLYAIRVIAGGVTQELSIHDVYAQDMLSFQTVPARKVEIEDQPPLASDAWFWLEWAPLVMGTQGGQEMQTQNGWRMSNHNPNRSHPPHPAPSPPPPPIPAPPPPPPPVNPIPACYSAPVVGTPMPEVFNLRYGGTGPRGPAVNGSWNGTIDAYLAMLGFRPSNIPGRIFAPADSPLAMGLAPLELYSFANNCPGIDIDGAGAFTINDVAFGTGSTAQDIGVRWPCDVNGNVDNATGQLTGNCNYCDWNRTIPLVGSGGMVHLGSRFRNQVQVVWGPPNGGQTHVVINGCYVTGGGVSPPPGSHVELIQMVNSETATPSYFQLINSLVDSSQDGQTHVPLLTPNFGWTGQFSLGQVRGDFRHSAIIGAAAVNANPQNPNRIGDCVAYGTVSKDYITLTDMVLEAGVFGYTVNENGAPNRPVDGGGNRNTANVALTAADFG